MPCMALTDKKAGGAVYVWGGLGGEGGYILSNPQSRPSGFAMQKQSS